LNCGRFEIEVPKTWDTVKQKNIGRYLGQIAIDNTDTLNFELGWYSDDLTERPDYRIEEEGIYLLNEKKSNDTLIYEFVGTKDSIDVKDFYKDSVSWTTIDRRKAILVLPKKSGLGTTGVYIDSLWTVGSEKYQFQINGKNLKMDNQRLFLEAIRTLRFKQS
jgi:hypothetical protein